MKKYPLHTPRKKMKLAQPTLELPYKIIGNGLNRMVYDLGNEYVLKIALSEIGLISNAQEFNLYHNSPPDIRQHLCPVMEMGQGWVVMKKMDCKVSMNLVNLQNLSELTMKFLLRGIVPVDLKLANIALTHDNQMVVIDYGFFIKTLY
jgi:RIO-like serine/threonine protein kinase